MEKCLFQRLKETVNNSSLEKFGDIYFTIRDYNIGPDISGITFDGKSPIDIYVEGDGYFADSFEGLDDPASRKTRETITGPKKFYFSHGPYKVHISPKHDLTEFNVGTRGTVVIINTEILKCSTSMTRITFSSTICSGLLNDYSLMTLLETLEIQGTTISGNISELSNKIRLKRLDIHSNSNIVGTIESMASGQVSAGRTSGIIHITTNNVITYNGSAFSDSTNKYVKFGSSMVNPTSSEIAQGYQVV